MNWNQIIENVGLFITIAINIYIVKYVINESKGDLLIDTVLTGLSGIFAIVIYLMIVMLLFLPLSYFEGLNITLNTTFFSDESNANTQQILYSILIFDAILYIVLRYDKYSKIRMEKIEKEFNSKPLLDSQSEGEN